MEYNFVGWRPSPNTPVQWFAFWSKTKQIIVPTRKGHQQLLDIDDLSVPQGIKGDPDVLIKLKDGREFYVVFKSDSVRYYYPLDRPVLVYSPATLTLGDSFWIIPNEYYKQ